MFRSLRFIAAWLGVTGVAWGQVAEVDRIFARYQKLRPGDAELSMYRLDWAASYEVAMRRAAHEGRAIFLVIIHAKYGDIASGHC